MNFDIEGSMSEVLTLLTSGQMLASVSWGVDSLGNPLIPPSAANSRAIRLVCLIFSYASSPVR